MLRQRGRVGLMAAALVGLVVGGAQAQVTTDRSASIVVFPKVISDGTRDTIIQITNTSNSMVHAHCFYVNAAPTDLTFPPGPLNPPLWSEVDFSIWLTKQQPTHWVVSEGRLVDPTDQPCDNNPPFYACNGAGTDPGLVPPVQEFFTGELKCIETDASGAPVSGNHLKGEATLVTFDICDGFTGTCVLSGVPCTLNSDCEDDPADFDVAKYNAIGIVGNENNDGDGVLCLGGEPSADCPQGAEYDACPAVWIANHFAEDAPDPVHASVNEDTPDDSSIDTSFTFVPCTENFLTQDPTNLTIAIVSYNEFEQPLSAFANVTCWADLDLEDISNIFDYTVRGSSFAQTRLRPTAQTQSGFLMVGEEFHEVDTDTEGGPKTWTSSAAVNYHVEGERIGPDIITIPPEQVGAP